MNRPQANMLRAAIADRRNILVAGGTSTGKTTLVNALLAEIARTADRIVLIEDTRELQCKAENLVVLRTKDGVASLSDLVRSSLRSGRIAFLSVRSVAQRRWTCSRRGGEALIAAGRGDQSVASLRRRIEHAVGSSRFSRSSNRSKVLSRRLWR